MYTHPEEWRRFVDSSKFVLKAVLLHNRNIHPSVPTTHTVHMKETYENMDLLLKAISYSKYGWNLCEDIKRRRVTLEDFSLATQRFAVLFVNGTAEQ